MKLAIATLAYNQPQLVRAMLKQIGMSLIVIDNGSNPPLQYPYRTIRFEENGYFSGGWNAAMREIKADWVAMLNSDVQGVSELMLYDLVSVAERRGYDAISPAFNSPHAHMQPTHLSVKEVNWLDWTAVVIRKAAWEAAGGFNEEVFPGYGADLDLCYRLKELGCKFAVDGTHRIHHLGSVTALAEGLQGVQGDVGGMNRGLKKLYGVSDWTEFVRKYL